MLAPVRRLIVLIAAACCLLAITSGAALGATLTGPEKRFAASYEKLVPKLDAVNRAITSALNSAGKRTDAQITTEFTGLARRWQNTTRQLLALKAPSRQAGFFATIRADVSLIHGDLRAIAKSGRTHSVAAAKGAASRLIVHFAGLAKAVSSMKRSLNLK